MCSGPIRALIRSSLSRISIQPSRIIPHSSIPRRRSLRASNRDRNSSAAPNIDSIQSSPVRAPSSYNFRRKHLNSIGVARPFSQTGPVSPWCGPHLDCPSPATETRSVGSQGQGFSFDSSRRGITSPESPVCRPRARSAGNAAEIGMWRVLRRCGSTPTSSWECSRVWWIFWCLQPDFVDALDCKRPEDGLPHQSRSWTMLI
jgi:hypothetical protein